MATTATLIIATPAAGLCPVGPYLPNTVGYINANATVEINDDSTTSSTYFRQSATPQPVANGIWDRIGGDAFLDEPLGRYVYFNGRWIRQPNYELGEHKIISYDPTGLIDSTGKGLFVPASPTPDTPNIAGKLFGWALANNQNGTSNIHNRFMLGGDTYDTTQNHWLSSVQNQDGTFSSVPNGGRSSITLSLAELPSVNAADYKAASNQSTPMIYGGGNYDPATAILINPNNGPQTAIPPPLPLFCSVAVFQWIGLYSASQS